MKFWMVITAIVSGCVGAAAARLVIPPARAQNVQRWEYFCVAGHVGVDGFEKTLNQAGQEGWELVAVGAGTHTQVSTGWCFKRPLP